MHGLEARVEALNERPAQEAERVDPDTPLVIAAGQGDMEAAAKLIDRHSGRLFAIGYRMLGDREAAEDLVQDVFFKVWKHASKWEPGRALFSTWLHRVAVNLCYDRLRKKKEDSVEDLPEPAREVSHQETAETILQRSATMEEVRAAVASLPERQRAAITLCHFEGMTNREAAEVLETTDEAVESLLARGRRKLRDLLVERKDELLGAIEFEDGK